MIVVHSHTPIINTLNNQLLSTDETAFLLPNGQNLLI